ncbi:MAG: hypothetical protein KDK91_33740, partial [Gammaproteobacteria bacterium]|nr:hypothetical protein [Gammaproteobacteria bacterium]
RHTCTHNILKDNAFLYQTPVFAKGLTLNVTYPEYSLSVMFTELGGREAGFEAEPVDAGTMRHRCTGLLLPGTGYILTLQRR